MHMGELPAMTKAKAIRNTLAAEIRTESLSPTFSLPTIKFRLNDLERNMEDMRLALDKAERRINLLLQEKRNKGRKMK